MKKIQRLLAPALLALGLTFGVATLAEGHQPYKEGDVSIVFHAEPKDNPYVNTSTPVWVHLEVDGETVPLSSVQNARLDLLAPDGQLLNQFDGEELREVSVGDHPGAFGTNMTFGQVGDFQVRFQGKIGEQQVNRLFQVSVRSK